MSTEPPPGSGQPPEDDPFRKQPRSGEGQEPGSPYDAPHGDRPPPSGGPYGGTGPSGGGSPYGGSPYGGGPYGGDPYGGGPYGGGPPADPLAGMPPLADSGKRTLARFIDMVLLTALTWLILYPVAVIGYSESEADWAAGARFNAWGLLGFVIYIAYDTVLTARRGQTLGKKLMRIRVAGLDDGATPSVSTALLRAAVLWIPSCCCLWLLVTCGWSFFDKPYKQGLHDKAAKTVVVDTT